MGNGLLPIDPYAARVGSVTQLNGPDAKIAVRAIGGVYPALQLSDRTFRYGGPGVC
jgi:hypothetical protein